MKKKYWVIVCDKGKYLQISRETKGLWQSWYTWVGELRRAKRFEREESVEHAINIYKMYAGIEGKVIVKKEIWE